MVCVLPVAGQSIVCLSDYLRTISTTWNVKDATWQYCITQPVVTKSNGELAVNGIAKCDLKTAQQRKYLLRQIEIKTV